MPQQQVAYSCQYWLEFLRKNDQELRNIARVDIFRGSGRGGQKKNKTSNAIRLTLNHLTVNDCSSRSKTENLAIAIKKLRLAIALDFNEGAELRPSFTKFPQEILPYLQGDFLKVNAKNSRYPFVVGIFIDLFIEYQGDWKQIAEKFQVSSSQMRKFAQREKAILEKLNTLQHGFTKE